MERWQEEQAAPTSASVSGAHVLSSEPSFFRDCEAIWWLVESRRIRLQPFLDQGSGDGIISRKWQALQYGHKSVQSWAERSIFRGCPYSMVPVKDPEFSTWLHLCKGVVQIGSTSSTSKSSWTYTSNPPRLWHCRKPKLKYSSKTTHTIMKLWSLLQYMMKSLPYVWTFSFTPKNVNKTKLGVPGTPPGLFKNGQICEKMSRWFWMVLNWIPRLFLNYRDLFSGQVHSYCEN